MTWIARGALLALLLASPALAQTTWEIHKTTAAGTPVRVRYHVKLTHECQGSIPVIDFSQQPEHGKVEVRPARFVPARGSLWSGVHECEGREVDGGAIWYTPDPGFHGVDHVVWTAQFGLKAKNRQTDTHSAEITVQ